MTSPSDASSVRGDDIAARLGLTSGMVVQEIGWDDDVDEDVRDSIETAIGSGMVEDVEDVVDAVILWFREDDGDLVDSLVDALADLDDAGVIWLLTPKPGRPGNVEPSDISDAAPTAGLSSTSTISASRDWQGTRLVAPRQRGR
jgi:hypothetical protein